MKGFQSLGREDDGSVAVGFKVDSHVELCSGMVQPLDSGRGADDWEAEGFLDIFRGSSVGIGGLYNADFQVF